VGWIACWPCCCCGDGCRPEDEQALQHFHDFMAEQESKGKLQRKKSYNRLARGILQVGACPVLGEPPPPHRAP
jgi:hypothetical protein